MPIYHYYGGESAVLAMDQPDAFVVDDRHGRRWFVVKSPLESLAGYSPRDLHQATLEQVFAMQTMLVKGGHTPAATLFGVLTLESEDELPGRLSEVGLKSGGSRT